MNTNDFVHPLKTQAKVLLSGVFGPYAQDDEYGSRKINPMELYHNQVTRVQGPFSLRNFIRSFGLMLLQENIDAPCTLLDFPTLDRFIQEIQDHSYDIVGISSIWPNICKVKKMCKEVRKYLPDATIVVGGHIANMSDLQSIIDADHVVKGDGVRWFRRFLGQNESAPVKHPLVKAGFGFRMLGMTMPGEDDTATVISSAGCPVGCNFCCTSTMFGGRGKFVNFYETGNELFTEMCRIEEKLKVRSFFVLDENFLLHHKRALRLLELIEQYNKSWSLAVFSSADTLQSYTIDQLVSLGIFWVWMGLEGKDSKYTKLNEIDTRSIVQHLQSHGIVVMGSTIIGLENHTPKNIDQVIEWAVGHETDFHQFMLYMPGPGTPLFEQHLKQGTLLPLSESLIADSHGQYCFNYRHEHIHDGQETEFLLEAFYRDFRINGPSIARAIRTALKGWKRYKNHPDPRIRDRYKWQTRKLQLPYFSSGAIWAMKKWYRNNELISKKLTPILQDLYEEFGWRSRIIAYLAGRVIYFTLKREARRLANGWTYEPTTFYEKNAKALKLEKKNTPIRN